MASAARDTNVDIAAGNDTPIIRFVGSPVSGAIIGNAGAYPINRHQTDHQFVYNVSTVLGSNHSIKAGMDIRRQQLDDRADNFTRGFWNLQPHLSGHDLRHGVRGVSRRMRAELPARLRTGVPGEPAE